MRGGMHRAELGHLLDHRVRVAAEKEDKSAQPRGHKGGGRLLQDLLSLVLHTLGPDR